MKDLPRYQARGARSCRSASNSDIDDEEEDEVAQEEQDEDMEEDEDDYSSSEEEDSDARPRRLSTGRKARSHYDFGSMSLRGSRTNCKGHWSKDEVSPAS